MNVQCYSLNIWFRFDSYKLWWASRLCHSRRLAVNKVLRCTNLLVCHINFFEVGVMVCLLVDSTVVVNLISLTADTYSAAGTDDSRWEPCNSLVR